MIEYNVMHSVVLETFDSAAVYSSDRDWTKRGTTIRYNLAFDVGSPDASCNKYTSCCRHAFYFDALTMGLQVYGNVAHMRPSARNATGFNYNHSYG